MDLRALVPEWIRTLTPYPPGKPIEEVERELGIRDSIKLASNENPLGPSPKAVAAIATVLADLHRYPDGSAFYLKRRLAERLGVSEAELIVGNGSNEIIELAVRTFLRPGDEAVMADQAFVIYRMVVQAAAGTPRIVPLPPVEGEVTFNRVRAIVGQRCIMSTSASCRVWPLSSSTKAKPARPRSVAISRASPNGHA